MINLNINDFTYELPKARIAKFPLDNRSESKLLCFMNDEIIHDNFSNLDLHLDDNTFIVRNSTKVIFARINASKPTGGKAEILCVEPIEPSNDPQITLASKKSCTWKCIVGGKKITRGVKLQAEMGFDNDLEMTIISKEDNEAIVQFDWDNDITFSEILDQYGEVPLPPYLDREPEEEDAETYQTVYAKVEGSVAAPTAGLHFEELVLNKLKDKKINIYDLVLHVGPGTFLPVSEELIANHKMHEESIQVDMQLLRNIISELKKSKKLIAVGTTTLRTLESLYQYGYKLHLAGENIDFNISQWEAYENESEISFKEALETILKYHKKNDKITGKTSILIAPGYKFKTADALITNFHQPKSTLLLLISAFIGKENVQKIYASALENNYRFLSYGDSSILFR